MGHSAPRTGTTNLPRPTGECREITPSRSRSANNSKFRANYQDSGRRRAVAGRRRGILKGGPNISEIYFSLSLSLSATGHPITHIHTLTPQQEDLVEFLFSLFSLVASAFLTSSQLWADKIFEPRMHCEVFLSVSRGAIPSGMEFFFFGFLSPSSRWGTNKGEGI